MTTNAPKNLQANTIDELIESLGKIVSWAKDNNSRLGYFPALYRRVTIRVKEGIENGYFDDGPRMDKLDVVFGNRYLEAFEQYQRGERPTEAWNMAFVLAGKWQPIVLQHLLLGMNAHIDLDLAISAAQTTGNVDINELKADFFKINDILISMIKEIKEDLGKIWPMLKVIDLFVGRGGNWLAKTGMLASRKLAWDAAVNLSEKPEGERKETLENIDRTVCKVGETIMFQGYFMAFTLLLVRITEVGSIRRIISVLE